MPAHLEGKTTGIKIDHPLVYGAERVIMCTCNRLLRDTEWASMAHSLEVRTPLVDFSLLQRLAPLIATCDLAKTDMARTPKHSLPRDLLDRPKSGFWVPMRKWLLADRPEYRDARGRRGWVKYVYDHFT